MNIQQAKRLAVQELEKAFRNSGWSDGWGLKDKEIAKAVSPLYYRNATPSAALNARVGAEGQAHCFYLIYNAMDARSTYANDMPYASTIMFAVAIYYDEAFLFDYEPYSKFIEDMVASLTEDLWVVTSTGDSGEIVDDTEEPYLHKTMLYVSKTYN